MNEQQRKSAERVAMELALDLANMHHTDYGYLELRSKVRQFAKEALSTKCVAQPEQQPVALVEKFSLLLWDYQELERAFEKATGGKWVRKSNTPQRTWVGLTDEQMRQICGSVAIIREAVREAEAILKKVNT